MSVARVVVLVLAFIWGNALADATDPIDDWAQVLTRFVDSEGRTDFVALARERAALDRFVAWLAVSGPRSTPVDFDSPEKTLAFHLNAYNALAMHGVIERGIPRDFSSFFKRASFFRFREIRVDGVDTNLYDYENDVIRPLGEPRVHFALNCMVRACPRLPRTPFTAPGLEADLDALTREFFSQARNLRLDPDARRVHLSAILDFYTRDFAASGRDDDLIPWINRYLEVPIPADYRVRFIDYDWRINQQP